MSGVTRWVLLVLLFSGVLALVRPSSAAREWVPRCPRVPLAIGPYFGTEIAVPLHWCELLETRDILLRDYARDGEAPVTLCLVFSAHSRRVAHPPEVCYSGQGFEIADRSERTVGPPGKVREVVALTVGRGGERQRVFAFYRSGEVETCSFIAQQLRLMGDALVGRALAAAFIRVSTPLAGGEAAADRRLEAFLAALSPVLEAALR